MFFHHFEAHKVAFVVAQLDPLGTSPQQVGIKATTTARERTNTGKNHLESPDASYSSTNYWYTASVVTIICHS